MSGAVVAALGVAIFGLGAIPAQEASAAGIVTGVHYMSAVETEPATVETLGVKRGA